MSFFFKKAKILSERLNEWNRNSKIMIIGHRDGDGISATSVLIQGLKKLGFSKIIPYILLSPDLDILTSLLKEQSPKYVITCDIGAAFSPILKEHVLDYIITDHHPNKSKVYGEKQLNCIEFGLDDETDASGSITAFSLLMQLFDDLFWETEIGKVMLAYAISGATSDFQFQKKIGTINKNILNMAERSGAVKITKDISLFGRGLYPVHIALNRSGIPGFSDVHFCYHIITKYKIQTKEGEIWRRIIDLNKDEKQKLVDIIINRIFNVSDKVDIMKFLKKEVIGQVYDLEALRGWDCTLISDGRFSLDPREILHKINYCCRLGHWDLALTLLNEKKVAIEVLNEIEELHKLGDREVAEALEAYSKGILPVKTQYDGKVVLIDFTDYIFYDEVGVVAGVIMKLNKGIEIILSSCQSDKDGNYKVSVRAREKIWEMIDPDIDFADAKKVYEKTKLESGANIKYGGHRFAMSGYMPKEVIPILFKNMTDYYKSLM
ncbi:MAG: DHH family phosphoesterase [Candidatus Hodarchaeota archaeon]